MTAQNAIDDIRIIYCDTCEDEHCEDCLFQASINALEKLKECEEPEIPCKVDDAVYCIVENSKGTEIMLDIVTEIHIHKYGVQSLSMKQKDSIVLSTLGKVPIELCGIAVFSNESDAKKALAERGDGGCSN